MCNNGRRRKPNMTGGTLLYSLAVMESNRLDSMRIYLHNKGAFDRIESHHHTSTAALAQEDAFHAAKYSGADDYALAHLKIGMGRRVAMLNSFFDPVNLVFRNYRGRTLASYQRNHIGQREHPGAFHQGKTDKKVSRKKRHFKGDAAVF